MRGRRGYGDWVEEMGELRVLEMQHNKSRRTRGRDVHRRREHQNQ